MRLLLATLVLALWPASALAADQTIRITETDPANPVWTPMDVSVDAGDTVTWDFTGATLAHNVHSTSANWSLASPDGVGQAPATYTFTAAATYTFQCTFHNSMHGTVTVGNPPPPPLSEQPFPNDQTAPVVLELSDTRRPRLSGVRVRRIAHGARVRFHVTEPARVTIRAKRRGRTVASRSTSLRRAATRTVSLRGLNTGSYRIEVLARDLAGNRSRIDRTRLTVR